MIVNSPLLAKGASQVLAKGASQVSAKGASQVSAKSRVLLGVVALALVTSACVSQGNPKVAVTKVEADLVFGVKEPEPPAPPPNTSVDEALPETAFDPGDLGGFDFPDSDIDLDVPPPAGSDLGPCPPAAPSAVAERAVDVNITGLPTEGLYQWQRDGSQKPAGSPPETPGRVIDTFEKRIVRNVKQESPTVHTFETVQPDVSGTSVVVSSFRVRQDALNRDSSGAGLPVAGPRVGEPDRGVALTGLEVVDSRGNTTAEFRPTTPVLLLPLPVSSNEEYQSVGVDPRTGQTLVHTAKVLARERVDACGTVVDGWAVEATQTGSTEEAPTVTYRYLVAPQYGGLIISEKLTYSAGNFDNDFLFRLGQLVPDPLPVAPQ